AVVAQGLAAPQVAVAPAEDAGLSAARRRQRLEAETGQDSRRAGVPRVRNDECSRSFVQGAEAGGLLALTHGHRMSSWAERVHEVVTVYDPVPMTTLSVRTPMLEIGYEADGPASGFPIVLLHGFPDDVRAFDGITPGL